mgnify:CR=1 FL=1
MPQANQEVAVKETKNDLAIAASFEDDAVVGGFDDMTQEDLALPFLKLLTNMSPEVGDVQGASPGMIYNSVTGSLYSGTDGITVIPCAYLRQYIEWAPRGSGGGGAPVAIHPATSDILSRTHKEPGDNRDYLDNGNYIENTANHYVLVKDGDAFTPALIVMKSTQLKKSRKWNSMMMSVKLQGKNGLYTPPMYSQQYRLTVVSESNDKGKWHGWEIERIGSVETAGEYESAKAFANQIGAGEVNVKHQDEQEQKSTNVPF